MNIPEMADSQVLPHNAEAERLVIGVCLSGPEEVVTAVNMLSPFDFTDDYYREIFAAIVRLHKKGLAPDAISVDDELPEKWKSTSKLITLSDAIPVPIKHHCTIILEAAGKREIINNLSNILVRINDHSTTEGLLEEISKTVTSVQTRVANVTTGNALDALSYSMTEELDMEFPEQKSILGDWLKSRTMNMLHGGSGHGKTWLELGITLSLATGVSFVPGWKVHGLPLKVLMVDGEMDCDELRNRKVDLCKGMGINPKINNLVTISNLHLIERGGHMLDLSQGADRLSLEKFIVDGAFQYVSLDNLSCLIPGVNIKASEEYSPFNTWLIKLKGLGVTIQFVHHDNRSDDFMGANEMTFQVYSRLHVKKGNKKGAFIVDIPKLRGQSNAGQFTFEIMPGEDGGLIITEKVKRKTVLESAVFYLTEREFASKEALETYLTEHCEHTKNAVWRMFNEQKGYSGSKKKIFYDRGKGYFVRHNE